MIVPPPPRRTIIAGTRSFHDFATLVRAINESGWLFSEIVSGHARGVDQLGERYAAEHRIPLRLFPAQWRDPITGLQDRSAGHKRNYQMALYADALIALWDGRSPGTRNMIETMRKQLKKPTFVWRVDR